MTDRRRYPRATRNQLTTIALLAQGLTFKEVATRRGIAFNTVKRQVSNAANRSGIAGSRVVQLVWLYRRDIERDFGL